MLAGLPRSGSVQLPGAGAVGEGCRRCGRQRGRDLGYGRGRLRPGVQANKKARMSASKMTSLEMWAGSRTTRTANVAATCRLTISELLEARLRQGAEENLG